MGAARGRHGNTTGRLVAGLALLLGVGLAAWYWNGRTPAVDAGATWTPERVASEPAAYLDACEAESRSLLEQLSAHETSLASSSGGLRATQAATASNLSDTEAAIAELKGLFLSAREQDTWPLQWRGKQLDKAGVSEQLQQLSQQLEHERAQLSKLEVGLDDLKRRESDLAAIRAQLERQLALLPSWRARLGTADGQPRASELMGLGAALEAAKGTLQRDGLVAEPSQPSE